MYFLYLNKWHQAIWWRHVWGKHIYLPCQHSKLLGQLQIYFNSLFKNAKLSIKKKKKATHVFQNFGSVGKGHTNTFFKAQVSYKVIHHWFLLILQLRVWGAGLHSLLNVCTVLWREWGQMTTHSYVSLSHDLKWVYYALKYCCYVWLLFHIWN